MNDVFTWPVGRGGHPATGRISATRAPIGPVLGYAVATTLAGTAVGLLLGLAAAATHGLSGDTGHRVLIVAIVATSLVAILLELGGLASLAPQRRTQVPRRWLLWQRPTATALGFGLLIGSGFLTPMRFASAYVLAGVVILAPTPLVAAMVGAIYGAARGFALVSTWLADTALHRRLPWEALASSRPLRTVVAVTATICLAAVLVLGAS